MNIFKEAKQRKKAGKGYRATRVIVLWISKNCAWQNLRVEYGIRWSHKWQLFPIWNTSNNCQRALMFGVWKLYFEIAYYRKDWFNQDRKLPFRNFLWKTYQLIA